MSRESQAIQLLTLRVFNYLRDPKSAPMEWEWPAVPADLVTPEERARLMAVLEKYSAFNRPDPD